MGIASALQKIFPVCCNILFFIFYRNSANPNLKVYGTTYYPDRFADREIQQLKVICKNKSNGCEWSDCLQNLEVCFLIF